MHDERPLETYAALLRSLDRLGLAYLHVSTDPRARCFRALARECFGGALGSSTTALIFPRAARPSPAAGQRRVLCACLHRQSRRNLVDARRSAGRWRHSIARPCHRRAPGLYELSQAHAHAAAHQNQPSLAPSRTSSSAGRGPCCRCKVAGVEREWLAVRAREREHLADDDRWSPPGCTACSGDRNGTTPFQMRRMGVARQCWSTSIYRQCAGQNARPCRAARRD